MIVGQCAMLQSAMDIDFELFDEELNLLFRALKTPYPQGIVYNQNDYYQDMKRFLDETGEISLCYHHLDHLFLLFVDMRVPYRNQIFYVTLGPFLTHSYSDDAIRSIIHDNHMPLSLFRIYQNYYSNLRYLTDSTRDIAMIVLQVLLGFYPETVQIRTLHHAAGDSHLNKQKKRKQIEDIERTNESILNNYAQEKIWRKAIQNGDYPSAKQAFGQMSSGEYLDRIPQDPLRAQKNLLITVNTLGRAAATDASVDVIRIHHLSDYFAVRIEGIKDALEVSELWDEILSKYCQLCASDSTIPENSPFSAAIQYLYSFYQKPLGLTDVAKAIHMSPSHLSRSFIRETGMTVGRYLTRIRLKEAIDLLHSYPEKPITDIALQVGFSSYSKFSVALKEETGMTAKQIRRNKTCEP